MYQVLFFHATYQVKSIAIAVSKVNPLVEIGDCCSCVHLHVFFPTKPQNNRYKELLSPNTHFYFALYSKLCSFQGITFNNVTFCMFEINHDDGTITGILTHLNATQEPYIDLHLICRHRVNYCINCMLLFQLFMIVSLLAHTCNCIGIRKKNSSYVPVIGKCHKSVETNLVYFVLAQFHSKKAMDQPPCFNIEY